MILTMEDTEILGGTATEVCCDICDFTELFGASIRNPDYAIRDAGWEFRRLESGPMLHICPSHPDLEFRIVVDHKYKKPKTKKKTKRKKAYVRVD